MGGGGTRPLSPSPSILTAPPPDSCHRFLLASSSAELTGSSGVEGAVAGSDRASGERPRRQRGISASGGGAGRGDAAVRPVNGLKKEVMESMVCVRREDGLGARGWGAREMKSERCRPCGCGFSRTS